jgi:hypothetical protein
MTVATHKTMKLLLNLNSFQEQYNNGKGAFHVGNCERFTHGSTRFGSYQQGAKPV